MKGIVLAGGLGTRLRPLTLVTNKHLLPVYNKPMIFYPLETLRRAGINEVMVVVGGPYAGDFISILKNGEDFGFTKLQYAFQDNEGGIAKALSLAESFANGEDIMVILGDNTTDGDLSNHVRSFKGGATIFLKEVSDPHRFGVPVLSGNEVLSIEEKPKEPKSNFAVTGIYMYDRKCFDYIRTLSPSQRGELEISDLNNLYIRDKKLSWSKLEGFWKDAGTFETLFEVNSYWRNKNESKSC